MKPYITIIFRVSFVTFVLLFVVEWLIPGFVTSWLNPIWLLIITVISGTISTNNNLTLNN